MQVLFEVGGFKEFFDVFGLAIMESSQDQPNKWPFIPAFYFSNGHFINFPNGNFVQGGRVAAPTRESM